MYEELELIIAWHEETCSYHRIKEASVVANQQHQSSFEDFSVENGSAACNQSEKNLTILVVTTKLY